MSAFSDYLENAIINATLRNVSLNTGTVYVALATGSLGEDDSGETELTDSGYARQTGTFSNPSGGVTSNSAAITFPAIVDGAVEVSHWGIYDGDTGSDNLLYHGALTNPKNLDASDVLSFPIGALTITLQ
jgi:hypothetical protein